MRESDAAKNEGAIVSVRNAEFAAFKLRGRIDSTESHAAKVQRRMQGTCSRLDSRKSSLSHRNSGISGNQKSISFVDMEEDYTIARQPGELGCPFARKPKQSSALARDTVSRHNLPTPRSSGSRSHRPSFNDPLRPSITNGSAAAEDDSDKEETGPACPIRFLDQHSPEEVAAYFEKHKHELPSSHADCVKRFQTSADSIKELDAKYGSLVTMIQGLGHKHQPMLPDEVAVQDEDTKSARKIKKWAKAVSDEPHTQADEADMTAKETRALSEAVAEERISHFDRPLKEVRVGESPSRPWGVPIPSKYLDRAAEGESSETSEPAAEPPLLSNTQSQPAVAVKSDVPKGKCPFEHGAGSKPVTQVEATNRQMVSSTLPQDQPKVKMISPDQLHEKKQMDAPSDNPSQPLIINHSLAVVSNAVAFDTMTLENRGTLILGYDGETTLRLQSQFYQHGR